MDSSKYIEKCEALLNTGNFENPGYDNTKEVEEKVQKTLFKIKKALGEATYEKSTHLDLIQEGSTVWLRYIR